jgi:hypothetical protein
VEEQFMPEDAQVAEIDNGKTFLDKDYLVDGDIRQVGDE